MVIKKKFRIFVLLFNHLKNKNMSLTKRYIEDLQQEGMSDAEYDACYAEFLRDQELGLNPTSDAEYDACYGEFLRDQERDMAAEKFFEENPEIVTVLKSDDTMPVTKEEVKSEEKVK